MKIGIVQSRGVEGELARNVRRIVQGVRACMEGGAQLAIAGAAALDGALCRSCDTSYRLQAKAALAALAEEMSIPLLLASEAREPHEQQLPHGPLPYLLFRGEVQRVANRAISRVGDLSVFTDVGAQPTPPPPGAACDLLLHLPLAAWCSGQDWAAYACREARGFACPSLVVQSIGSAGEQVMGGGSAAASARGGRLLQLPHFKVAERVWNPARSYAPQPPARPLEAVLFSLRERLQLGGFTGYAVRMDAPHSELLLALATAAVGARRVTALLSEPAPTLPRSIRRAYPELPAAAPGLLQQRIHCACYLTRAEELSLCLLSPLTHAELLLGEYTAPAALHGHLAPLRSLWDSELAELYASLLPGHTPPPPTANEPLLRSLLATGPIPSLNLPHENEALRLSSKIRKNHGHF